MNKNILITLIILLILSLFLIPNASSTELFFTYSTVGYTNLSEIGSTGDAPSLIIMQEIPKEFLTNVTYIDSIKLIVGAGKCDISTCNKPNGKLYFKIYKNIAGVWTYQTGSYFLNTSYYDLGTPLTNSFSEITIDNSSNYGIGFYTDVVDLTNGSWILLGSHSIAFDVSTGYNVWKTHNQRICNYDSNYVCNPYNIFGLNTEFTDAVNHPKIHTVFPSVDITTINGYPYDVGLISMYIYGQTIFPPTPTPTPTPTPIPHDTPFANQTNKGNLDSNSTRPDPYHEGHNTDLLNNSLPTNSTGFNSFLGNMGYEGTIGGIYLYIKDYSTLYVCIGIVLYLIMLFSKPRG